MSSISWLANLLASIIGSFDSKEKGTAVVLLMAALFVLTAGWCLWRHWVFISRLRVGSGAIDSVTAEATWSPADRLNAITKALEGNTALSGAWSLYRGTLRDDPRREGAFINLIEPRSWFTPERLPGHGYEKWAGTFAGVFLTIGLMFTFVGLSAALFKVGDAGADAVHLRQAINGILSVSSAKFITSIAGIVLFICWTLIARCFVSSQNKATSRFASRVQGLTTLLSPEGILVDQLLAAREQTDRMRTLADDVAVAFEAKLTNLVVPHLEAFPEKVEASLTPVVQAIEHMGANIGDGAKQGIQDTVREMIQGMSSAAGEEMRSVVKALKSAADELKAAQGSMGSSGDHFGSALREAADGITASVAKMTDAIERRLGDLEGRIERVDDALDRGATSISGMSASMSDAARLALEQALKTVSDEAARAAEQARQQSQAHMEPLLAGLRDLISEIRSAANEGKEYLANGGKVAADTLTTAAVDLGGQLSVASSEASAKLSKAAASMAERMDGAVEQFRQIEAAVADQVHQLRRAGQAIDLAGNAFGSASERLRQAAEPVSITLERVEASARHATDTLRIATAANDTMREASARLADVSKSASEVFESYQKRFEGTDRALGTTVRTLIDGSIELSRQFSEIVGELDRHLTEAVGKLATGVQDIRDMTRDLSEVASEMRLAGLGDRAAAE
jgi:hypothetical protein